MPPTFRQRVNQWFNFILNIIYKFVFHRMEKELADIELAMARSGSEDAKQKAKEDADYTQALIQSYYLAQNNKH